MCLVTLSLSPAKLNVNTIVDTYNPLAPAKLTTSTVLNAYNPPSQPVPSWDGALGPAGPLPDNQTLAQRAPPLCACPLPLVY
jgi:hypothetical protein